MNVMYTCDNNYVWLMGISAISLFENNKRLEELKVYLLGENISSENKEELKKIGEKYNREVEVIDVPKIKHTTFFGIDTLAIISFYSTFFWCYFTFSYK